MHVFIKDMCVFMGERYRNKISSNTLLTLLNIVNKKKCIATKPVIVGGGISVSTVMITIGEILFRTWRCFVFGY